MHRTRSSPITQSFLMTEFVAHSYISIRDAVDRLARGHFPEVWTGDEYQVRSGLISEEDWLQIKDLPLARGGGCNGGAAPKTLAPSGAAASDPPAILPALRHLAVGSARCTGPQSLRRLTAPHRTGDPASSSYQKEYRARKRYEDARKRLRTLLEAGELEAAILDPFKGKLHRASTALWRRHDADRMIERGERLFRTVRIPARSWSRNFLCRAGPARHYSGS